MVQTATRTNTINAEILAETPAPQPLALANGSAAPKDAISFAAALASKPKLAAALVQAIQDCQAVEHDAFNQHHKYNYTSAEAIIAAARQALSKNGLCLIPVEQTVNGHEREGPDRYELVQKRLLLHVSGESVVCSSAWPIMPGNGRPLDKATAAADTLSLNYFLRDLLQIPRVDQQDDIAARDDTRAPQKPKKADRPEPTAEEIAQSKTVMERFAARIKAAKNLQELQAIAGEIKGATLVAPHAAELRKLYKEAHDGAKPPATNGAAT